MPTKAHKSASVEDLKKALGDAQIAIVADYRGLSVKEITDLRRRVQKTGGDVTVAKNTLIKVAMQGNDQWAGLDELLKGPTALVIGREDFIEQYAAFMKERHSKLQTEKKKDEERRKTTRKETRNQESEKKKLPINRRKSKK